MYDSGFGRSCVLLKLKIKNWLTNEFGCIDESRETLSKALEDIDKVRESRDLNLEEIVARHETRKKIRGYDWMEEISWR